MRATMSGRTLVILAAVAGWFGGPLPSAAAQDVIPTVKRTRGKPTPPPAVVALAPANIDRREINRRIQELSKANERKILRPPAPKKAAAPVPMGPQAQPPAETPPPAVGSSEVDFLSGRAFDQSPFREATHFVNGEPSVAMRKNGLDVLLTANTFAAVSGDGGSGFSFIDPAQKFPQPEGKEFFCDQAVLYDRDRDLMMWYMQHKHKSGEGNLFRLAVARGDDIATGRYHLYDFVPTDLNPDWTNTLLDFPDIVSSSNFLYISLNVFNLSIDPEYKGAVMVRLPLDQLQQYEAFDDAHPMHVFTTVPGGNYQTPNVFGYGSLRGTRGAKGELHFAAHPDVENERLRVHTWKESETSVSARNVAIQKWKEGPYVLRDPDGRDWLGSRADGRILVAWQGGDTIGFGWAASGEDAPSPYRRPHVRVAILNRGNMTVLDEPHLYSDGTAYAYPAAAANLNGELGLGVIFGGGAHYPSYAVGYLRPPTAPGQKYTWKLGLVAKGTIGPSLAMWGDYIWVCADPSRPDAWVGVGHVPQKITSQSGEVGQRAEVQFVRFIRPPGTPAATLPGHQPMPGVLAPAVAGDQPATRKEIEELRREVRELRSLLQAVLANQNKPDR